MSSSSANVVGGQGTEHDDNHHHVKDGKDKDQDSDVNDDMMMRQQQRQQEQGRRRQQQHPTGPPSTTDAPSTAGGGGGTTVATDPVPTTTTTTVGGGGGAAAAASAGAVAPVRTGATTTTTAAAAAATESSVPSSSAAGTSPAASASAAAAAARARDGDAGRGGGEDPRDGDRRAAVRVFVLDQLTHVFGFDRDASRRALEDVWTHHDPATVRDPEQLISKCTDILLDEGFQDRGGPVRPIDTCPHVSGHVCLEVGQLPFQPSKAKCTHYDRDDGDEDEDGDDAPSAVPVGKSHYEYEDDDEEEEGGANEEEGGDAMTDTSTNRNPAKAAATTEAKANKRRRACPSGENWICLECGAVRCSRYVNGHALAHWAETRKKQRRPSPSPGRCETAAKPPTTTTATTTTTTTTTTTAATTATTTTATTAADTEADTEDGHCIHASLADLSVWCHCCSSYVNYRRDPKLANLMSRLEQLKFFGCSTTVVGTADDPETDAVTIDMMAMTTAAAAATAPSTSAETAGTTTASAVAPPPTCTMRRTSSTTRMAIDTEDTRKQQPLHKKARSISSSDGLEGEEEMEDVGCAAGAAAAAAAPPPGVREEEQEEGSESGEGPEEIGAAAKIQDRRYRRANNEDDEDEDDEDEDDHGSKNGEDENAEDGGVNKNRMEEEDTTEGEARRGPNDGPRDRDDDDDDDDDDNDDDNDNNDSNDDEDDDSGEDSDEDHERRGGSRGIGVDIAVEDEEELMQVLRAAAAAQGIPLEWIIDHINGRGEGGGGDDDDDEEIEYPFEDLPKSLEDVAKFIQSDQCQSILILAGAGMSVASGIPDFRSADGLYATMNPDLLTATEQERSAMRVDPTVALDRTLFVQNPLPCLEINREFILGTREQRWKATLAHRFVELLHSKTGKLVRLYTQNIDGLEDQCGQLPHDKVIAVHGSMDRAECEICNAPADFEQFAESVRRQIKDLSRRDPDAPDDSTPIACRECGANMMKPAIVLFRSSLPKIFFESIPEDVKGVDLLIVMGTSLQVAPANSLVWRVPRSAMRVLVNREPAGYHLGLNFDEETTKRDYFAEGNCEDVLLELMNHLGWLDELEPLLSNQLLPESSSQLLEECLKNRGTSGETVSNADLSSPPPPPPKVGNLKPPPEEAK